MGLATLRDMLTERTLGGPQSRSHGIILFNSNFPDFIKALFCRPAQELPVAYVLSLFEGLLLAEKVSGLERSVAWPLMSHLSVSLPGAVILPLRWA